MSKKEYIKDKEIYYKDTAVVEEYLNYAKTILGEDMSAQAKKMNINLRLILLSLLFSNGKRIVFEDVVSQLAGIKGSLVAYDHFKKRGLKVERETVFKNGDEIPIPVDLVFEEKNIKHLCEVKTISQILLTSKNYKLVDFTDNHGRIRRELYSFNFENRKRIFSRTGKKLLKQMENLCFYRDNHNNVEVNLIVMKNVFIDEKIKSQLKEKNINIIIVPTDIGDVFDEVTEKLEKIYLFGKKMTDNITFPTVNMAKKLKSR